MVHTASFRFYGSLNDFLRNKQKNEWLTYGFDLAPAVKDAIEAIGVPHPEVTLIKINKTSAHFYHPLQPQDQVEVYPAPLPTDLPAFTKWCAGLPAPPRFILDVHLGKLAKALRLLGFDTLYKNNYSDAEIAQIASSENRIVLTRDVGLLKQKNIGWGYWLRSQHPDQQLIEVLGYFGIAAASQPFTRCLVCNGLIQEVPKEIIIQEIPPLTQRCFNQFFRCPNCCRIYWKGSHYDRLLTQIANVLPNFNLGP